MSGTGNCYDNAPMESFWHSMKVEETHGQNFATRAEAKHCVFAYIEGWYNTTRMHSGLGYKSPTQFERDCVVNSKAANDEQRIQNSHAAQLILKSGLIPQRKLAKIIQSGLVPTPIVTRRVEIKQPATDTIEAIRRNNAGRDPERLEMKYAKMRESPFVFLRGACHLFYDALPGVPALSGAPLAWCCGDMHFENFGSYKADNRLVYFDLNDFDEAALAPCTWDIIRLLTSIHCGAKALNATASEAMSVSRDCLANYRAALMLGKPLWVEAETSAGLVHELFVALQDRSRAEFLDRRTIKKGGRRSLKVGGVKALDLERAEQGRVTKFIDRYAAATPDPKFFKVLDVARRIAGTGSLGVMRYIILVEGKGSPDGNYLLDLKQAMPSALFPALQRLGIVQAKWSDNAVRVTTVQNLMQAVDHAFLSPVVVDGMACVLKGLQPSEDRVAIGAWGKKLEHLREVVRTMGSALAWDQLRASGHGGAANADALIEFAQGEAWMPAILDATEMMVETTQQQWKDFCSENI
jgi:uncharacterized protein (DUF2252 family)